MIMYPSVEFVQSPGEVDINNGVSDLNKPLPSDLSPKTPHRNERTRGGCRAQRLKSADIRVAHRGQRCRAQEPDPAGDASAQCRRPAPRRAVQAVVTTRRA